MKLVWLCFVGTDVVCTSYCSASLHSSFECNSFTKKQTKQRIKMAHSDRIMLTLTVTSSQLYHLKHLRSQNTRLARRGSFRLGVFSVHLTLQRTLLWDYSRNCGWFFWGCFNVWVSTNAYWRKNTSFLLKLFPKDVPPNISFMFCFSF